MILKDMKFKQRLEYIYDFFKSSYTDENIENEILSGSKDEYYSLQDPLKLLYGFAVDAMGYNGFPTVLSDTEWETLQGETYYHGYEEYDHGANFLNDYKYHYGDGRLFDKTPTNGFYVTKNRHIAKLYTKQENCDSDSNRVLPVKLKQGKTAYYTQFSLYLLLMKNGKDFTEFGSNENVQNFLELKEFLDTIKEDKSLSADIFRKLIQSPTLLAVLMDYEYFTDYQDALSANGRNLKDSLIIHDRSKLMVSEKDFKRFLENSNASTNQDFIRGISQK